MTTAQDLVSARVALGEQLAAHRHAAGHSQAALARLVFVSRSSVGNTEVGRQVPTREFWQACDDVLSCGGRLIAGFDELESLTRQHRVRVAEAADADLAMKIHAAAAARTAIVGPVPRQPQVVAQRSAVGGHSLLGDDVTPPLDDDAAQPVAQTFSAPAGQFFDGMTIDAQVHPAVDDGRVLAAVPPGYADDEFLRRPRRGLVIGLTADLDAGRAFGLDSRQARRRLSRGSATARLVIPRAYALDHLTLGILWACANLDQALLNDDRLIADLHGELAHLTPLPRSAVSRELAADLSPTSRMWLGSEFCARHILDRLDQVTELPEFWTREQRGEEASTWLLFDHKYTYLRAVADRFAGRSISRAFCIPPELVVGSPKAERVLVLLAAALMESFGIDVAVCTEPEYAAVEGFVLDHRRRAIVANWVGVDGIWHVDMISNGSSIREYGDVVGFARAHSVVAGTSSRRRLLALADYLELDWRWLVSRCAELGEYGCAGIAEPRSRLLSLAGADRACRYVGALDITDG
jgi:DNA-binding XRE family transcriptional regulator